VKSTQVAEGVKDAELQAFFLQHRKRLSKILFRRAKITDA